MGKVFSHQLGAGGETGLFDGIDARKVSIEIVEAIHSPRVTHLRYSVTRR